MFRKGIKIYLQDDERNIVAKALIDMRNNLIRQGKYTDVVDEILLKVIN